MIEDVILINKATQKKLNLNMSNGPLFLESVHIGPVEGEHCTYRFPGQDGESQEGVTLGTRDVDIIGWAVDGINGSSLEYKKAELNKFCNPKESLLLQYRDYELEFSPDSSIQYSKSDEENNDLICKFMISGTAFQPLWHSIKSIKSPISYVDPNFILPLSIPPGGLVFGVIQPTVSTKIINNNLAVGCKIIFKSSGEVVNPGIICAESQEQFTLNKTLQAEEGVEVSTVIGQRYIKGYSQGEIQNYMKYMKAGSSWITIYTGVNTFSFFAESGAEFLEASVEYFPQFLEVEE